MWNTSLHSAQHLCPSPLALRFMFLIRSINLLYWKKKIFLNFWIFELNSKNVLDPILFHLFDLLWSIQDVGNHLLFSFAYLLRFFFLRRASELSFRSKVVAFHRPARRKSEIQSVSFLFIFDLKYFSINVNHVQPPFHPIHTWHGELILDRWDKPNGFGSVFPTLWCGLDGFDLMRNGVYLIKKQPWKRRKLVD